MKKILFLLFTLLVITGCGKDEDNTPPIEIPSDNNVTVEDIFKETGCKPKDIKSIKKIWLFVDSLKNERYLYGSKMKNDIESFWVAKFTSQGEQIWETIKEHSGYISNAFYPNKLSTGDIVFAKVLRASDLDLKESSPVIIKTKDGSANFIKVFDGYYFTDVHTYDNFFFCSISQKELDIIPTAIKWYVQINNEGKILSQNGEFRVPDGKTIWPTDSIYVCMNSSYIQKEQIYSNSPEWTYTIKLPKYKSYKEDLSINADEITASYFLTTEDSKQDTVTYRISYKTGKDLVKVEGVSIEPKEKGLIIGEEFTLTPIVYPEDASIKDIIWKSSNESIATIDEFGKVKAINKGECTITAVTKDGNFEATSKIKVTSEYEVNGIYFTEQTVKIIIGSNYKLHAAITPATALNKNIKWKSSDNNIVHVSENGVVTGNTIGDAIITAETEDGGYKANCYVTIVDIKEFITLNFSASISSFINGYVTGNIYSQITNNSSVTINVTGLTVVDTGTHRIIATADKSFLGDLQPNSYFSIGGAFYSVYYPMFIWEYEYKGQKYSSSHTLFKESFSNLKSTTQNKNGLIWLDE